MRKRKGFTPLKKKDKKMKRNFLTGFTLAELIIVLVLISVLTVIAMPKMRGGVNQAMMAEAVALLGTVRTAERMIMAETGSYVGFVACNFTETPLNRYLKTGDLTGQYYTDNDFMCSDSGTGRNEKIYALKGPKTVIQNLDTGIIEEWDESKTSWSWWFHSDLRLKENIAQLPSPLSKLENIRGVSYDWKRADFKEKNFPEGRQIGIIAQELEKEYPELVSTDNKGYKSVDYGRFTAVLIEAIKAQQKEIEGLKKDIAVLKNRS